MIKTFTLIVPYYRNVQMLREQIHIWEGYPEAVQVSLVDDGSPDPALPIVRERASKALLKRLSVYRIGMDIPWNRGGARNLGAKEAQTQWIVHVDIDHVLPAKSAAALLEFDANPKRWYKFERYRNGQADETRLKDKIPRDQKFGKIHPHMDSYLVTKDLYWRAGGYDEDYSGCLGGGSPFLKNLESVAKPDTAPPEIHLQVYTRSMVADASDFSLDRGRSEYAARKRNKERMGQTRPVNPIRFPWTKQI